MNDYEGKICPYCKTEFKPEDDIVVCSQCDMPHHKDCWVENQGCTTFGCLGTIKAVGNAATTVTATQMHYEDVQSSSRIYCTRCGEPSQADAAFCRKCGAPMRSVSAAPNSYAEFQPVYTSQPIYTAQPQYSYAQPTDADVEMSAFVGANQQYYLPKFRELSSQGKTASWNWPAFLFAAWWFIYRKMYGYGFGILGAAFLISLLDVGFLSFAAFGGYILLGIFANNIYMKWAQKHIAEAPNITPTYKIQHLQQRGGTNVGVMLATMAGYGLLMFLFLT